MNLPLARLQRGTQQVWLHDRLSPPPVAPAPAPAAAEAGPVARAADGTHLVQLGSFSSEQGARRAWGILAARNPERKNTRMTITPAAA